VYGFDEPVKNELARAATNGRVPERTIQGTGSMSPFARAAGAVAMLVALAAGVSALVYARWTHAVVEADASLAAGRYEQALAGYAAAEARFDRFAAVKELFAADYEHVMASQLWTLYQLQRYDEAIDVAQRAPERAQPHFWSGCAFFEKARAEEKPDPRLGWLTRAEEELRRAVEAAPSDWDTKYDFELVTKLAAELRKQPRTPPNQLMQLLRPQPKPGAKPVKRVG
jgi:tetratricopeptide (TPR) repeat protein